MTVASSPGRKMTQDDLESIKKRAHSVWVRSQVCSPSLSQDEQDIANLLRHIDSLQAIADRDKSNASHRLHNLCDALHEQADESPCAREEWDRIDRETVRVRGLLTRAAEVIGWKSLYQKAEMGWYAEALVAEIKGQPLDETMEHGKRWYERAAPKQVLG